MKMNHKIKSNMKLSKNYKKIHEELDQKRRAMNEEIKKHIYDILLQVPGMTLDLQASPAYATVETMADEWVEHSIYGVRLHKSGDDSYYIECTTETEYPDEDPETLLAEPKWDEEDCCIDEFDHYSTINWLSLLRAVSDAVEKLEAEPTKTTGRAVLTVIVDYEYDPSKNSEEEAVNAAVDLAVVPNFHTISGGVQITEVQVAKDDEIIRSF